MASTDCPAGRRALDAHGRETWHSVHACCRPWRCRTQTPRCWWFRRALLEKKSCRTAWISAVAAGACRARFSTEWCTPGWGPCPWWLPGTRCRRPVPGPKSKLNGIIRLTSAALVLEIGSDSGDWPSIGQRKAAAAEGAALPSRIRPLVFSTNCVKRRAVEVEGEPNGLCRRVVVVRVGRGNGRARGAQVGVGAGHVHGLGGSIVQCLGLRGHRRRRPPTSTARPVFANG